MSNGWKMVSLEDFSIDEELYAQMVELASKQNASISNNVGRLIRKGIEQTWKEIRILEGANGQT